MNEILIDLGKYVSPDVKNLSGRPKGEKVRTQLDLDNLDESPDSIIVIESPDRLRVIASSFFLGMLGQSVRNLGEEKFLKHYTFKGPAIMRILDYCIREALKEGNPLE